MSKEEIGARVTQAYRSAGYKRRVDFSDALGVHYLTLWRYETGRLCPSLEIAVKIGELCGVTAEWLLRGEGSQQ